MPTIEPWRSLWARLGTAADDRLYEDVLRRWSEPHRSYHTLRHLDECLEQLELLRRSAQQPDAIELALWFHDIVYEPLRNDNEQKSADFARSVAIDAGLSADLAVHVHDLVMATRHDAVPDDIDKRTIVDVDLAIPRAPDDLRHTGVHRGVRGACAREPRAIAAPSRAQGVTRRIPP